MQTKYLKNAVLGLAAVMALNSCQEQIDEETLFTFRGNTIATYLQSEPECSDFVEILTRGECIGLMKAYGQYTCFAPNNAAIERYLIEQDSIYWTALEKHEQNPELYKKVETVHAPVKGQKPTLKDLTDEKCGEIARNHILPKMYYKTDFIGNSIADANMNERDLTLNIVAVDGEPVILINSEAKVKWEEETENGVVHILEGVVNPSSLDVPTLLNDYTYFSLFMEALNRTGYADVLTKTMDDTYTEGDKIVQSIRDKEMAPYPANRRYGYTLFLESNKTLQKAGVDITNFNSLVDKCKEWYPNGTPAWAYDKVKGEWTAIVVNDAVVDKNGNPDYTNPCHPLNQFIGYHILDRKVAYENLVCYKISVKGTGEFDSEKDILSTADRTEYYVTMNNRILKVTMPRAELKEDIYLNYAPDDKGQNIKVYSPNEFKRQDSQLYSEFNPEALNGVLNVIEDVLLYNEEMMKAYVLKCIMRFDASALFSELTNNRIRWKYASNLTGDGSVFIPHYYCDRVKVYADDTRLYYLAPHTVWHNYQGDEMMALGLFDFAYLLPPVPEGTYEIRMGYSASSLRHVVQVYLDNEVAGLPIDLRILANEAKIGSILDKDTDDNGVTNDKDMKNRGYLKGPTSFRDNTETGLARDNANNLRAVIATKHLSAGSHWLRFKNVNETDNGTAQFMHDYFEIVPMDYLKDESVSLEEKRK